MEISGKIKVINPVQQVTASFKKRDLVITTDEQYPQHILIEFTQDKTDLLDNYRIGQEVKVSINLRGREWINPQGEAKYFNQIQGWRIESLSQAPPAAARSESAVDKYQKEKPQTNQAFPEEDHDDLPF